MSTCYVKPAVVRGRQGVAIGNEQICVTVVLGGGHIALIQRADEVDTPEEEDFGSPLWVPPWPTCDPAVAEAADEDVFGETRFLHLPKASPLICNEPVCVSGPGLEGKYVLQHIMGHNLCLDIFGDHSPGEVAKSGLAFHGEAGQVTWKVTGVDRSEERCSMTLSAHLRQTCLDVTRVFTVKASCATVKVEETMKNLVGFQRAMGRAEHVTFGAAWLRSRQIRFSANADQGRTWPDPLGEHASYAPEASFAYPNVPSPNGGIVDWREYPQKDRSEGLCTMRVAPEKDLGWFCGEHRGKNLALAYAWQRRDFPWIMNWEENCARMDKPWDGRVLTRGLEFSSYAFPTSREKNVAMGSLLETPCFEWLDAHEEKATTFYFSLQPVQNTAEPLELAPTETGLADAAKGFVMEMH